MNIMFIDFGNFWTALSSIGTLVCAILALYGNPNLFRKWFVTIKKARISPFNNTKTLCAEVVLSNNSNFNITVNQIVFLFGKAKKILVFGRDNNDILPMGSSKKFFFCQVQTYGEHINDKKIKIKKLDLTDIKYAMVYAETSFGSYHRKLKEHELTEFINLYKKITNKKAKL